MSKDGNQLQQWVAGLIYVNKHYSGVFTLFNLSIYTYKALRLPVYPESLMAWDFCSVFLYFFIDHFRLEYFKRSNRSSKTRGILLSLLMSAGIVGFHIYYLLQYYVLRIDYVMNIVGLILLALQFVVGGLNAFLITALN
jgi:hypothetical protein